MDDELMRAIYHIAHQLSPGRGKRQQYSDATIVCVYFWSVIRRKPRMWACEPRHAAAVLAHHRLPSESRLSRRMRSASVLQLLDDIERLVHSVPAACALGLFMLDAKPLVISPYSKDKQARRGYAYDGKARGYKVFLLCDANRRIVAWRVYAMNHAEPTVARELIPHADAPGYVLGDKAYDSNALYALAGGHGLQLMAPRKKPHSPIGRRARDPHRLHAIAMLEAPNAAFGPTLYEHRTTIERVFAQLACSDIGLDHLPGHVRTPPRVARWAQACITLYGIKQQARKNKHLGR